MPKEKRVASLIDAKKCQKFVIFSLPLNLFNELKHKKYLFSQRKKKSSKVELIPQMHDQKRIRRRSQEMK